MGFKDILNNLLKGGNKDHDCMSILGILQNILDEEASDEERRAFHSHIQKCMPCYEKYDLDKEIKELLKSQCNKTNVPEGLIESIQQQINNPK